MEATLFLTPPLERVVGQLGAHGEDCGTSHGGRSDGQAHRASDPASSWLACSLAPRIAGGRPLLLLPSAGLQPRCGPFRLHVELAERLAAARHPQLPLRHARRRRSPALDGCDGRAATLAAIDRLQELEGCTNFAVGGICSAADAGWNAAIIDPRVSAC